MSLVGDLRRDPRHFHEIGALHLLPQLAPHVPRAGDGQSAADRDTRAKRLVRRTISLTRRDGAITGSSFYLGMPAAMASTFCNQYLMVLKLAALYGNDPADPARAAEFLVLQGRHPDVATAATALRTAGHPDPAGHGPRPSPRSLVGAAVAAVRSAPSMIHMKMKEARKKRPVDRIITVLQGVTYLVPVLSMPVWAASNARATRRLGNAAVTLYAGPVEAVTGIGVPPPPSPRARAAAAGSAVALGVAFLVVAVLIPARHLIGGWVVVGLAELFLVVTSARLLWLTRRVRQA